jgi:(p)ppGpp synthase/HD superfamily hydrolase
MKSTSVLLPLLCGDLVLDAMRIAEWAHRTRYRKGGPHYRKAPEGKDRPSYFLHLSQVAWMLESSGLDATVVAAGYLHDTFEDTTLSSQELLDMIDDERVVMLIQQVTEPPKADGFEDDWEKRNESYLARITAAPREAIALSCADKTANLIDFTLLMREGHLIESFASRAFPVQRNKFEHLAQVFRTADIPQMLKERFDRALRDFVEAGQRLR